MKKLILSISLISTSLFAVDGYEVYKKNCQVCHVEMLDIEYAFSHLDELSAPPMVAVSDHLKKSEETTHQKPIARQEFVSFVKDYIVHPHHTKSMCKTGVVEKFGTMPSLKGKLTEEEREAVAQWLYDRYQQNQ